MQNNNRADRTLIILALIILLIAGGLFYFDSWMWGGKRDRGDVIGLIAKKSGDVRLKFEGDIKWSRANSGDNLVFNDAVYAGAGSEAQLNVGESKMTVTENTLVVLRRESNTNFMNLTYGTLFGKVAKNDRLVIDTGNGKTLEFSTEGGANIILHKSGDQTQLEVTSGQADVVIDGKKRRIDSSDRVIMGDKVQLAKSTGNKLKILKPLRDQTIYSERPMAIEFAWAWDVPRLNQPEDLYTMEFSTQPDFTTVHATKIVKAKFSTSMNASQSLSLFFRVRGPGGVVSPTERVKFVRIEKPIIVHPVAQQHLTTPPGTAANVLVEFARPSGSSVWYQIATDFDFKNILLNKSTTDIKNYTELPEGQYYIRARGDFGEHMTAWTDPQPFYVDPETELRLSRHPPTRVLIPNRDYPPRLYGSSEGSVRQYLAGQGFLKRFFNFNDGDFDELKIQFENGERDLISQAHAGWPSNKLQPSRYIYQYQIAKKGHLPSKWSGRRHLEILMEPPRPIGEADYGPLDTSGVAEAQWRFTPLLFAASYDVEVASEPSFQLPIEFRTTSTLAKTKLQAGGAYFWRARARDRRGRIISEFSEPYRLRPMSQVPQFLAKNDRKPQATERVKTKVERIRDDDWIHNGWWAWFGAGANYTKYQQSIPNGSTFSSQNAQGPSEYVEAGYTGDDGWGGVFSFKRTPGLIQLSGDYEGDAINFENTYLWTTFSLEGIMRRLSGLKFLGRPLLLGFRAGLQIHNTPYVHVTSDNPPTVELKTNEMTTASLGLLAEMNRRRWNYYWLMRYQFPLTTRTDGASEFTISPTFAFDGSVGMSYDITTRTKLGVFWYGQWHQYNFTYSDGGTAESGFQSLFYSNMDLRLGIDF